jgi:hypothetical protein
MAPEPRSLREVTEESGFTPADVAYLTKLDESTICRMWDQVDWLDRVKGQSLQALIASVPGVGTYVCEYSLAARRGRLVNDLADGGLHVDVGTFQDLVSTGRVVEQHLANALEAAAHVMRRDLRHAAAHLARFWGLNQDLALNFLFLPSGEGGLLEDRAPLVEASIAVTSQLAKRHQSFHATLARANLSHQIAKSTDRGALGDPPTDRHSALHYRSATMGLLIETDDVELVHRYQGEFERNPLVRLVEAWAFPTYTRDSLPTSDMSVPRSLVLRRTATEMLREIESYNDAYFHYLMAVGIPVVLRRDPTFGFLDTQLKTAITRRLDETPTQRDPRLLHTLTKELLTR